MQIKTTTNNMSFLKSIFIISEKSVRPALNVRKNNLYFSNLTLQRRFYFCNKINCQKYYFLGFTEPYTTECHFIFS